MNIETVLVIISGLGAILYGVLGKRFYGADVWGGNGDGGTPIPRWLCGLAFVLVGIILLAAGIITAIRTND